MLQGTRQVRAYAGTAVRCLFRVPPLHGRAGGAVEQTVIPLTVSHGPRPLTAPTGADLISSNPGRGSLRGGDPKGRSRKGDGLAEPEHPFSLLLR